MHMPTDIGNNKTGVMTSPFDSARPTPTTTVRAPMLTALATTRVLYAEQSLPIGNVPGPVTLTGIARTAMTMLKGKRANVLFDKLGARAAFERSGSRLYDAALSKLDAYGSFAGGPSRQELERIRVEEQKHFHMVIEAIELLGGDPTAVTPSADLEGVMSMGLLQVITDPRTTLAQSLDACLVAELTDNACWENLISIAHALGHDRLVSTFTVALKEEEEHLMLVREWVKAHSANESKVIRPD